MRPSGLAACGLMRRSAQERAFCAGRRPAQRHPTRIPGGCRRVAAHADVDRNLRHYKPRKSQEASAPLCGKIRRCRPLAFRDEWHPEFLTRACPAAENTSHKRPPHRASAFLAPPVFLDMDVSHLPFTIYMHITLGRRKKCRPHLSVFSMLPHFPFYV